MEVKMPAITADTLTLARVSAADPADTERPVRSITTGPHGYEGEGFPVVRAFAGVSTAALDPFVHMDQMGEVEYQPGEPRGTDWHPHRGFETVTYMIDGRFAHQDSHGGGGLRHPAHRNAAGRARRERWDVSRHPALGEPAEEGQVRHAALPGHRRPRRRTAVVRRRRRADPRHRGRDRRSQRARCHAHSNHYGARHNPTRGSAEHPLEPGLQRTGLRPGWAWLRWPDRASA